MSSIQSVLRLSNAILLLLTAIFVSMVLGGPAQAASAAPLPRFVSIKSARANMRVGPGLHYRVEWLYVRSGLPMEVIQEYDNWRKVRDSQGSEGWIMRPLLSGKRTALIAPWDRNNPVELVDLHTAPDAGAPISAHMTPGLLARIVFCNGKWCRVEVAEKTADRVSGYVDQSRLWGVYPGETVKR